MAGRQDRVDWVGRVLGVSMGPPDSSSSDTLPARWQAARAAWQRASDAADAQIAALQTALLARQDPTLKQIAEFGLGAVVGGQKVRLMAAMADLGDGSDPAKVARGARKLGALCRTFLDHLASSEQVAACDENPYGPRVALRATLAPALTQMMQAVQQPA